jgi:tetratricopeptide (TPR) repeat protein
LAQRVGRKKEVEAFYRKAIAAANTDAWHSFADLLAARPGRAAEAEAAYRKAIAAADTDARKSYSWLALGGLLAQQRGRRVDAESAFREALDSGHGDILRWAAECLGDLLGRRGDVTGARAAYDVFARACVDRSGLDMANSEPTVERIARFMTAVARLRCPHPVLRLLAGAARLGLMLKVAGHRIRPRPT